MNENEIAIFDDMLLETATGENLDNLTMLTAPMVGITNSVASHTTAWNANQVITANITASDIMYTGTSTSSVTLEDLMSRIEDMKMRIDEITESVKPKKEPVKHPDYEHHANFIASINNHMHGLSIVPPSHNHSKTATAVMQQIDHAKVDADRTSIAMGTPWFNTDSDRQELFIREHQDYNKANVDNLEFMVNKYRESSNFFITNPPYAISETLLTHLEQTFKDDEATVNFERAMEIIK